MELGILKDLEKYRLSGEYNSGLEKIERNNRRFTNLEDQIQLLIAKARFLEGLSEYKQCLELCGELFTKIELDVQYAKYRGPIKNLKGFCYFIMINLDEALDIVSTAHKLNVEFENEIEIVRSLNYKAEIYYYQDKLELALQSAEDAENFSRKIMYHEGQAKAFRWIGGYFHRIGKYKEALEFFSKSHHVSKNFGFQQVIADILLAIGYTHWRIGELKVALEYASESCTVSEQLSYQRGVADALCLIGNIYHSEGDIINHKKITDRVFFISRHLNYQSMIGDCFFHLGTIYSFKGELDLALEYYEKSRLIYEKYGGLSMVSLISNNIGEVFFDKNELDLAFDSFQTALKAAEEINSLMLKSLALHSICANNLSNNNSYKTIFYNLYHGNQDNKEILTLWNLQKAIDLKLSKRLEDVIESKKILYDLTRNPSNQFRVHIEATFHLIELLLLEYKLYKQNAVLEEITHLLTRLLQIAQDQHLYPVILDILMIRAKIAIVENQFDKANQFIEQALITADEKHLTGHLNRLKEEKSRFEEILREMKNALRQSYVADRLEKTALFDYITRAKRHFTRD